MIYQTTPVVTQIQQGFIVKNLSLQSTVHIYLNGHLYRIIDNYITPGYADVLINNVSYNIYGNTSIRFDKNNIDAYYIRLLNLTSDPRKAKIDFEVFYGPSDQIQSIFVPEQESLINITLATSRAIPINLFGMSVLLNVSASKPGKFTLDIKNITSSNNTPSPPYGYNKLLIFNISVNSNTVGIPDIVNISATSNCDFLNNRTTAFILVNGSWNMMPTYSVNSQSCVSLLRVNKSATLAVMYYYPAFTNFTLTTIPTKSTTVGTTSIHNQTITSQPASTGEEQVLLVVAAATTIVLVIMLYKLVIARIR
ncbi:MAG: hypothetical protein M1122_02935 [Candidatus Marsarchaeota archaeon]|nr:hypothetical protein [Candidatus Marsarchaeota archaeon]